MKLVSKGARPVSGDTGLLDIRILAEEYNFPSADQGNCGSYKQISILDAYVKHILGYIDLNNLNQKLELVINSGNGAAGHIIDAIESYFLEVDCPIEIIKVYHQPDGNFPNGIPNPLLPECRKDTAQAVIEHGANLGIAFVGDFDRCFFFDEQGDFIEGYYIVGLLAEAFLGKYPASKIIHNPHLTWNTVDLVQQSGGVPVLSKTGHAFIKERMRQEDAIYSGEMSAHHYFRDFAYCDSGMIPWLLVVELISRRGQPLREMVHQRIAAFPASGEINCVLEHPAEVIEATANRYVPLAVRVDYTDGISIEIDEWRFNLRSSNTEPVVRLNVETKGNNKLLHEKTEELLSQLH